MVATLLTGCFLIAILMWGSPCKNPKEVVSTHGTTPTAVLSSRDSVVQAALMQAELQHHRDPGGSFELLDQVWTLHALPCQQNSQACMLSSKTLLDLEERRRTALTVAVSRDDIRAWQYLAEAPFAAAELATLRAQAFPKLLAAAEQPTAVSANLLLTAGVAMARGLAGPRNRERATGLLGRAWIAGALQAAQWNAHTYAEAGDPGNAYLWALRCVDACSPDIPSDRSYWRTQISDEIAGQAHLAAGQRSRLKLDPSEFTANESAATFPAPVRTGLGTLATGNTERVRVTDTRIVRNIVRKKKMALNR